MPLEPGDPAPAVSAPTQDGEVVSPDFEEPTVLYFYPRDDTSGCTIEARQFEAELDSYREAGVQVYGVSTDGVDSHADFAADQDLSFSLLADPEAEIAEAFDVSIVGGGRPAAARTTFVVADGVVQSVYTDVAPDGHARAVLGDMLDAGLVSVDWERG